MKKIIITFFIFLLFFSLGSKIVKAGELQFANVAKWIDGDIGNLTIDSSNTNILYFGTQAGSLYKSTDAGNSWTVINKFLIGINSVTLDSSNPKIMYLGMNGKICKTMDGGLTWQDITTGLLPKPYSSVFPNYIIISSPNKELYALEKRTWLELHMYPSLYSDVYKSLNQGATWEKINLSSLHTFVLVPNNANVIYASSLSGINKTIDGGKTWKLISNLEASSLAIDPLNPKFLYAATVNGLFKSTDSGDSWTQISYLKNSKNTLLIIDPKTPNILYFESLNNGIYKSTDSGTTWNKISGLSALNPLLLDPSNPSIIYGTTNSGIYGNYYNNSIFKSSDGGINWKEIGNPSFTYSYQTWFFNTIEINPKNSNIIFAGAWIYNNKDEVLYRSVDAGNSWTKVAGVDGSITCITFDPKNPDTIYVGTYYSINLKTLIKTTDGGATWTSIDVANLNPLINTIVIDPNNSNMVYVATDKGLFKTLDGGLTWQTLKNDIKNQNIRALALDPKNSQILYAGAYISTSYSTTSSNLYKSLDEGNTWTDLGQPILKLAAGPFVPYVISIDPTDSNLLYAGTNKGLFQTIDGGISWNKLSASSVNYFVISPDNPQNIYMGTSGGVLKSSDGGLNWQQIPTLPSCSNYPIAIDFTNSDTIYIGSKDGIYKQKNFFRITQTIVGIGSTVKNINQEWYPEGSLVALGAIPQKSNIFKGWKGDFISNNPEIQLKMGSDKNILATFKPSTTIKLQIVQKAFTINGENAYLDSPPVIANGRTLLPIRAIIEAFGGTIDWLAAEKKVTIVLGATTLEFRIGKNIGNVNGFNKLIDSTNEKVVPEIINGRTMLPLRFVTENLGATVNWDANSQTITIAYSE